MLVGMFARQLIKAATENHGIVREHDCYPPHADQDRFAVALTCRTAESASAAFYRRARAGEQARLEARLESIRAAVGAAQTVAAYGADLLTCAC